MKKKIIIIALVFSLALVSLSGATQGTIDQLQGYWSESHDGQALLTDGDVYYANITAIAPNENEIAEAEEIGAYAGESFGAGSFLWDAGHSVYGFDNPVPIGEDIYFISEHEDGYLWATWRTSESPQVANPQDDMWGQYEPIPQPTVIETAPDYIEIQIDAPVFTCRYGGVAEDGQTYNQGTFELLDSYAVFMSEDGGEWQYLGNTEQDNFTAGPDDPIIPYDYEEDPETVDTGHFTFNATGLQPNTEYQFMVRMNLDFGGYEGGYGGGLGSYTTYGAGTASEPVTTPIQSEFGPGLMIPVVATVGIFVAITVYRRKKFE